MKVADATTMQSSASQAIPISLTWAGHDFIAAARSDSVWSKAMEKAKSVGGTLSFTVLKQLLESILKHQLDLQ